MTAQEYNNQQLTEHFNRKEFECSCHGKFCSPIHNHIDIRLVEICEIIRQYIGKPIKINSGCRCDKRNAIVSTTESSSHRFGWAADLSSVVGSAALFVAIKDLYDKGQIPNLRYAYRHISKNFVHIDIDCNKKRSNVFAVVK